MLNIRSSIVRSAAIRAWLLCTALICPSHLSAADAKNASSSVIERQEGTLAQMIGRIWAQPGRDFLLCYEVAEKGHYLDDTRIDWRRADLHSRRQILGVLRQGKVPYIELGRTVVIRDPSLATKLNSPMELRVPARRYKGSIQTIMRQMVGSGAGIPYAWTEPPKFLLLDNLDVNVPTDGTLRAALAKLAEDGDLEWGVAVTLPQPMRESKDPNVFVVQIPKGSLFPSFSRSPDALMRARTHRRK